MGRGGVEMNGSLLIAQMRFTHSLSFFFLLLSELLTNRNLVVPPAEFLW